MKHALLFIILSAALAAGYQGPANTAAPEDRDEARVELDLRAYLPPAEGWLYVFDGEGNEFAPFFREISEVDGPLVQVDDYNPGAIVSTVYRITGDEIAVLQRFAEVEEVSGLLATVDPGAPAEEVVLSSPVYTGKTWSTADRERIVLSTDAVVEVPAGTFYNCLVIEVSYGEFGSGYEYYAPNVGLVKLEHVFSEAGGYRVASFLAGMTSLEEGERPVW